MNGLKRGLELTEEFILLALNVLPVRPTALVDFRNVYELWRRDAAALRRRSLWSLLISAGDPFRESRQAFYALRAKYEGR